MSAIIDTLAGTLKSAPENWTFRSALVEALCAEDRYNDAIEVINEAESLPDDIAERTKAGRAYGMLDPESGLEVLNDVLEENPGYAPAHFEKANLCLAQVDGELARKHYFTAITFDPSLEKADFLSQIEALPAVPVSSHVDSVGQHAPEPDSPEAIPVQSEQVSDEIVAIPQPVEAVVVDPLPVDVAAGREEFDHGYHEEKKAPTPVQPVPLRPAGEPRSNVYYPVAGSIPVIPLSQAMAAAPASPRHFVTADAVPQPHINYINDAVHRSTQFTRESDFYEQLSNVSVRPALHEEGVTYDYQAPDDSIFEPLISADNIYVSALVTEDGEEVASIQESIEWSRSQSKRKKQIAEIKSKIQSVCIAITSMIVIGVFLGLVAIALPRPNPPQIVANALADDPEDEPLEKKQVVMPKSNVPTPPPAMGAASMETITATNVSEISMTSLDTSNAGLGMADSGIDFGSSMTFGTGGSEAMFFGSKTSGKRFLFVLDNSKSMKPNQVQLRNDELERAFKTLRNVEYQVLLFAGGAFFAEKGWGVKRGSRGKNGPEEFTSPRGNYSFKSDGLFDYELEKESKFEPAKWITATPSRLRRSVEFVQETPLFAGTDWDNALKMACMMEPPPDVIFFMSDGQDRKLDVGEIVKDSKRAGGPKINSIAMQTPVGAEAFAEIAQRTQGDYTIVDKDGKPIDGFKFIKNPKDFAGRL